MVSIYQPVDGPAVSRVTFARGTEEVGSVE
jgi:hypothetical protein